MRVREVRFIKRQYNPHWMAIPSPNLIPLLSSPHPRMWYFTSYLSVRISTPPPFDISDFFLRYQFIPETPSEREMFSRNSKTKTTVYSVVDNSIANIPALTFPWNEWVRKRNAYKFIENIGWRRNFLMAYSARKPTQNASIIHRRTWHENARKWEVEII